ncbi:hypothetical protein MAM1_0151d06652 [Mucor ambiguus]|uniref:DASH complex subunit DAD1 n=1 Tax=Mucor ambiguus TaxID=91626 RepID=A0A0C9MIG0_9FUNG|nr:hypothetical protein MAM1_0151d06652 [Mucor ambiguus]
MSSDQTANDTSVSNMDIMSDYQAQLDQLLQEVRVCLDRLSHNVARFNDGLQTMAAVGDQFAGPFHLWKSFHTSIRANISGEMECDEGSKMSDIDHLNFEEDMLEKQLEEDEKREDRQQRFLHNTMNETVVLGSSSFETRTVT